MFDAYKAFNRAYITDKQSDDLDTIVNAFCELYDAICECLPEDSDRVNVGLIKLQEAKFWFTEAVCKEYR